MRKCVVRGENMLGPGEDGKHTDVGLVCWHCMPAYKRAVEVFHEEGAVGGVRNFVNKKLLDASFVEEAIRDDAKRSILGIVEEALAPGDNIYGHAHATTLRMQILRHIDLEAFKRIDSEGSGLTLEQALACINEEQRTFGFIKVLFQRLVEMEKDHEMIEMVDAGCGPIPLFGLMAALKSDKVRVTCLEINPASYEMAKKIVEQLGLSDRVKVELVDATTYQHDWPVDLLVSETMCVGLLGEPIVQVLNNLAPQLAKGGVVIPEYVDVCAGIMNAGDGSVGSQSLVVPVSKVATYRPGNGKMSRVGFVLSVADLPRGKYTVALASEVGIGNGVTLRGGDSNITKPSSLDERFAVAGDGSQKEVRVSYVPGAFKSEVEMEVV